MQEKRLFAFMKTRKVESEIFTPLREGGVGFDLFSMFSNQPPFNPSVEKP